MRVSYVGKRMTQSMLSVGFSSETRFDLTENKQYRVYGVAKWRHILFYCLISDRNMPYWVPNLLFDVIDDDVPSDWIYTPLGNELEFLHGPKCFLKNEEAYSALVNLEMEAVESFWNYVDGLSDA